MHVGRRRLDEFAWAMGMILAQYGNSILDDTQNLFVKFT